MTTNVVRLLLLVMVGLLVGTMFGIWAGYNPANLSATIYVEQQQNAIRSLNTLLPVMGAICIVLAVTLAVLAKGDPRSRYLLVGAALLMVVAAVVTRFGNQPINSIVMSWSPQSPPAGWAQLRDQWWRWHVVRSVFGIGALLLTAMAILVSKARLVEKAA
jgi:uncharacterized membrane protein